MTPTDDKRPNGSPLAGWLLVLALSVPVAIAGFSLPTMQAENRVFAQWPGVPRTLDAVLSWPARVSHYVNDQFGLREPLIRLNNVLRYEVFNEASKDILVGERGWLFRAADGAHAPLNAMVMQSCGLASPLWNADYQANVIDQVLDKARSRGFSARFLIVPSALTVYRDHLPGWLQQFCGNSYPSREIIASSFLSDENRARVMYPVARMLADRSVYAVYPQSNFHWDGETPRRQAAEIAELSDRITATPLSIRSVEKIPENIGAALIGIPSPPNRVVEPDFSGSNIDACTDQDGCFGDVDDLAKRLLIVSRYRNAMAAPGKLVIVSDSFGPQLSSWMAPYYREVVQFATNQIRTLNPTDMQRLASFAFSEPGGDLLFVYNELNVSETRLISHLESLVPYIAPPDQAGQHVDEPLIGVYPTDAQWMLGFDRTRPVFLMRNDPQARAAFVPTAVVTFRHGERRQIANVVDLGSYLHVFYEGPPIAGNVAGPPDRVTVSASSSAHPLP
ncbi:MAG: hypothetical protein JHC61_00385 [Burkholderiaceae bacterium]|nr:hypothetical protein [Burkholderiaceae bacterium]